MNENATAAAGATDWQHLIADRLISLQPQLLQVDDQSAAHAGHAGSGGGAHLHLRVVSEAFAGLGRVQRHRVVYDLLSDWMPARIHALALSLATPAEHSLGANRGR